MYYDIVSNKTKDMEELANRLDLKLILRKELNIVEGGDEEKNRKAVSNKNVDLLLNPHLVKRSDGLFSRRSGLNQVLCKLANENNVAIGFSFDAMRENISLGRIKQDIRLCRKYKVNVILISLAKNIYELRDPLDVIGLAKILGMNSNNVGFLNKKI